MSELNSVTLSKLQGYLVKTHYKVVTKSMGAHFSDDISCSCGAYDFPCDGLRLGSVILTRHAPKQFDSMEESANIEIRNFLDHHRPCICGQGVYPCSEMLEAENIIALLEKAGE